MMRYLRLSSLAFLLLTACGSPYKKLKPLPSEGLLGLEPYRFQPQFSDAPKVLYRCHVDGKFLFKKFHLSGILLFKEMPEGGKRTRVVFSNEMGHTFFDFGWNIGMNGKDSFKVYSITPQLDKPAVVKTLRKDLELLMVRDLQSVKLFRKDNATWYRTTLENGYAYYLVDNSTKALQKIEVAGKKRVATIYQIGKQRDDDFPDSISIVHNKAHFTINAKKIADAAAE